MDWTKTKITRWQAGAFRITEEPTGGARPFRLDGPDNAPQHFETLTEAKAHAATVNELEVYKAEVKRLRAELETRAGRWPADVDAPGESDAIRATEEGDGRGISAGPRIHVAAL